MNYTINGDVSRQSPFTCAAFKLQFKVSCQMQLEKARRCESEKVELLERIIELLNNN